MKPEQKSRVDLQSAFRKTLGATPRYVSSLSETTGLLENFNKTYVNAPGSGRKWPVRDYADFKIRTKRHAAVLYISIKLYCAVDPEENMV